MALGSIVMPILIHVVGLRWSLTILALVITAVVVPAMARLRKLDATLARARGARDPATVPLFAPLEPKSLELIANQLVRVEVPAGDVVISEGSEGDRFYIVESGHLTATHAGGVLSTHGRG